MSDPLALERCQSCGNAFVTDEQADGTCGSCGGPFRRRGRPREGDTRIKVTVPAGLLAELDEWAARESVNRSEAVRRLLSAGLAAS